MFTQLISLYTFSKIYQLLSCFPGRGGCGGKTKWILFKFAKALKFKGTLVDRCSKKCYSVFQEKWTNEH
jgi:hypothetical protein